MSRQTCQVSSYNMLLIMVIAFRKSNNSGIGAMNCSLVTSKSGSFSRAHDMATCPSHGVGDEVGAAAGGGWRPGAAADGLLAQEAPQRAHRQPRQRLAARAFPVRVHGRQQQRLPRSLLFSNGHQSNTHLMKPGTNQC